MSLFGPQSLRLAVVGTDGTVRDALSAGTASLETDFRLDSVSVDEIRTSRLGAVDCLVFRCGDRPDETVQACISALDGETPVVLVVDDNTTMPARTVLREAAAVLPRGMVEARPTATAEQIAGALEDTHARTGFEEIFHGVTEGIAIQDPETGELLDANQTFLDRLGYDSVEEVREEGIEGLSATEKGYTKERARAICQRVAETGDPEIVEWQQTTSDGERIWIEAKVNPAIIQGEQRIVSMQRDVTERRELERTYRAVFENVSDGLVIHDPDTGEILDVNDRYCEMNGYDRDALVGKTVEMVSSPSHTSEDAEERIETARDEGRQLFEWKNQRADGDTFPVEVHLSVVDVRGEERVLASVRDITERKRREQEYEQMFNGVNDVINVYDPETGELVQVNDRMCELTGYDRETILEHGLDLVSATDAGYSADRASALIDDVMSTGEPRELEWCLETADGDCRWLEVSATPAKIGGQDRLVTISRDVTERRQREQEYEQIFNGVPNPITVNDPETGEMLAVNDALCETLGYDRETILEKGNAGIGVDQEGYTEDHAREIVNHVMETGEPETFEWKLETADGDQRVLEVTGKPATINGQERYVSLTRDITERKRREREFEQIFNGIEDPITIHDPETAELLDMNDAFCELMGYDREQLREMGIEGYSPAEKGYTMEQAREFVRDVVESGEPRTTEWEVETRDGERRWLEVKGKTAEIGGELRYIAIDRDITERKRRKREYEQIFDGVTDAITVHDPETGNLVDLNERMCGLTGYDREELLSEGQEMINVAEEGYSSERARRIVQEVMAEDEERTLEWLIERKDGDRRWLEINATPATLNGERRYLAIMRDVTEQRRTERRLRETLERIDEAIYLTRAADLTNPVLREDDLHAGYEAIWGQPLEQIFERYAGGFFDTLHPDEGPGFREFIADVGSDIESGTVADRYSREYRIKRLDGEVRWVHSDFYPLEWPTGELRIVILSRDVTERKERERRIASFDDATEDLATADTPAEATQTAVKAATEQLDLPAVGAFLYDNDEGLLRPEILTGPIEEDVTGGIEPGDDPLWEAFATGTIVAPDGGQQPDGVVDEQTGTTDVVSALEAWRGLALGNHGLLLVGVPDGALDSETIQSAHVLAATLEAALNHLEGQQQLAAREEQLQTQTERAERLDRLTRLTQQVESAITDASGPTEIEQAVCTRLVDSGPYDLGWIGGLDVGADRMTARAIVGAPRQYVDRLELSTTDTGGDAHPAVRAWQAETVHVEESTVGDGPAGQWRQQVLTEGFQSLCAIPLTYDGVTQGVLTVGSDSPNAFGRRDRDVLEQLGTSIGYALAAIERRRALESDETVELEFTGDGADLPFARAARRAGCQVHHERTVANPGEGVRLTFTFSGDVPEDVSEIATRTLPGDVETAGQDTAERVVTVETEEWFGAPLAEYGAVLRGASATPEETTITVEVSTQADVRSFVDRIQELAPSLELTAKRQHQQQNQTPAELTSQVADRLTDRQQEVVRTALSAGYFEWPRENDGREVADRLGITQPTLNKHLRLAEQETFELLFEPDT